MVPDRVSSSALAQARADWTRLHRQYLDLVDGISLVAELELSSRQVDQLVSVLRTLTSQHAAQAKVDVGRGSVALAVLLPTICQEEYGEATFWPHFWNRIAVPEVRRQALQTSFGDTFLHGLGRAGLPEFPDVGRRFLDNILMHAGIPAALLPDWFALLDAGVRAVGGDAQDVADWVRNRAAAGGLVQYDVPVRRFITQGGPFSADLLARSIDLLDALRAGPDSDPQRFGLPGYYLDGARQHCTRAPGSPRSGQDFVRRAMPPTLRLDPVAGRLVLRLPPLADVVDTLRWQVSLDHNDQEVVPMRLWGGDRVEFASVEVPVEAPVRVARVQAVGAPKPYVIPIAADEDLPMLAFDPSGQRLRLDQGLPSEPVWLLSGPSGPPSPADPLQVLGARLLLDAGSLLGWAGWRLRLWDLTPTSQVLMSGREIRLSSRARARVEIDPACQVEGASIDGLPVFATRPVVIIPGGGGNWSVEVLDYTSGKVLDSFNTGHVAGGVDPFRSYAEPVVGGFTIRVRGPLGRGTGRSLGLAEGLHQRFEPTFRTFTPAGLTPAAARIGLPGAVLSDTEITFRPRELNSSVRVRAGHWQATLTVTPPALAVTHRVEGRRPSAWVHAPVTLTKEDLACTQLMLRIGRDARPTIQVCRGRIVIQQVEPANVSFGRNVTYDLKPMTDAVDQMGASAITLGGGPESPIVLVARIVPRTLASGIEASLDGLRLVSPGSTQLEVALWSTGHPWLEPMIRGVDEEGVIGLLAGDRLAGRVVAVPRVRDDWVLPEPIPRFPYRFTMLVTPTEVDRRPAAWPDDPDQSVLPSAESRAWAACLLDVVLPPEAKMQPEDFDELRRTLNQAPAAAASALTGFALPPTESAAALLRTGVAARATSQLVTTDEGMSAEIWRDPVAGMLTHAPQLKHREADFPEAAAAARSRLGEAGWQFLTTGLDSQANQGAFGARIKPLDELRRRDRSQYEQIISGLGLRPVGLLHPDTRVAASMEVLERRGQAKPKLLAETATQLVLTAVNYLRRDGFERAAAAIEARGTGQGWISLSAASLAWALALRYGARGHKLAGLRGALPSWRDNVHAIAPLQAIDLVLAEIYATHDYPLAPKEC